MPHRLPTRQTSHAKGVGFFLLPAFSMMALASATEPLRAANRLSGSQLYGWKLLSRNGGAVSSSSGFLLGTTAIDEAPRLDRLFVVASLRIEKLRDSKIHGFLQRAARSDVQIGALSTGTFVLARAGLLEGYRCTLHWESLRQFAEEFPAISVCREIYVRDRDRLTCAGGTAAMDLMLDEISKDHGGSMAGDIAEQFLHSRIRGPQEQQRIQIQWRYGVHDRRMAKAIMAMEECLEQPLSIDEIAERCGISVRQLERLWEHHFGMPPQRFYLRSRLNEARRLLKESTESIASIALRCGFVSASHLGGSYRKTFGCSPGEDRRSAEARAAVESSDAPR